MLKSILFDMGNVLLFFSHERMCAQIGALCGQTGPTIRAFLIDSGLQAKFERGQISEDEIHRQFESAFGLAIPRAELLHAVSDIFHANDSLVPILQGLRAHGRRLVLLSNTCISHFRHARERFPVLDLFDDYVLSYEVGAIKPDPEIFAHALTRIHCAPEECFYTDDIPEYVAMGRRFGLRADLFTNSSALLGHLSTHDPALGGVLAC